MNLEPLVADVLAHAAQEAPRECCGVAILFKGRLRYRPCRNRIEGTGRFEIDPDDYAEAEDDGEVVGICHSHVFEAPQPSEADLAMCERTGLPWLIVSHPTGRFVQIAPKGYKTPLVGRPYTHGVLDCYQVIVDYYEQQLSIALPHFERKDEWWLNGGDLYRQGFERAGFVQVGGSEHTDIRRHDVLLMQMGAPVPNHAAIALGDGLILQHVQGRLSSKDVYGGYWRKATTHVLRHRALMVTPS